MMNLERQSGMTLVEMMISLVLGLMMTAIVLEIYLSNRATYRIQDGLARLQESGRYAHYTLARDIRMAGYQGCGNHRNITTTNNVLAPPAYATFETADIIQGHEATGGSTWSPVLPAGLAASVVGGTDVIVIKKASRNATKLQSNMSGTSDNISINDNRLNVQVGDILMITDCKAADIVKTSTGTGPTVITHTATDNISNTVSTPYTTDALVMRLESFYYYIRATGRTNAQGDPILALFQMDVNGNETEIIEGVENLQILYGVDTTDDGSVDTYQNADQVNTANNWENVRTVRPLILVNTVEGVNTSPQPYTFNGITITPTDRMLRRQWDMNITLRNRAT